MKSILVKKLKEEYGIRKVEGKKLESYKWYRLAEFIDKLKRGEEVK